MGRDEATGEVMSMRGRLEGWRMGDKSQRAAVPGLDEKRAKYGSVCLRVLHSPYSRRTHEHAHKRIHTRVRT